MTLSIPFTFHGTGTVQTSPAAASRPASNCPGSVRPSWRWSARPAMAASPPRSNGRQTTPACGCATPPPGSASWPRPPPRSASPASTGWSTPPGTCPSSPRWKPPSRTPPPGLGEPGHRLGPARPPRAAGPGAEPYRRRHQRLHERPGRRTRLAAPSHLGPPPDRLCPGQRYPDRRRPGLGDHPPPAAGHGPGRRRAHPLLSILGGLALWLLRLALAPVSTLAGFRAWVLEECPVAPGRRGLFRAGRRE